MGLNEFIFETFDEANNIHGQLLKKYREKGYVTCFDVLNLVIKDEESKKILESINIYHTHGWNYLWDARVEPKEKCINGEWVLRLPQPKIIK